MPMIASLLCGLIFGAGLLISGMVQPTKRDIDLPLIVGAALFGIGWGLVGLCPGPALESLATLSPGVFVFVVAMAAGILLHVLWQKSRSIVEAEGALANAADG